MTIIKTLFTLISRLPPGFWQAFQAAFSVLTLYLKGRNLELELARAKLKEQTAKAKAHAAKNWAARAVHEKKADQAAAEAKELEAEAAMLDADGAKERTRIEELSDNETFKEYKELVKRAKERANK